jgi:hypothetical protein
MRTFRQFVESRTPERMEKLLHFMNRRSNRGHLRKRIYYKHYADYPDEADIGGLKNKDAFHHVYKHVPVSSIVKTQPDVEHKNVLALAKTMHSSVFNDEDGAIKLLHKNGKHYVVNGHHRLLAAQLNRKSSIYARVSYPKVKGVNWQHQVSNARDEEDWGKWVRP